MWWIELIIVCIFATIMVPIEKRISRSVTKKWLAGIITVVVGTLLISPFTILYKYLTEE